MDLKSLLDKSPLTNSQRADLWDAFEESGDTSALEKRLDSMKVPDEVKANLWDLKASSKPVDPPKDIAIPEGVEQHKTDRGVMLATQEGPEGGALGRLVGGVVKHVNPVAIVKGLAQTVTDPMGTVRAAQDASTQQFEKVYDTVVDEVDAQRAAIARGEQTPSGAVVGVYKNAMPQAVGHFAAGTIPFIGPAAAEAGEKIASGDIAGGLGEGAGMVLAALAPSAAKGVARVARGAGAADALDAGAAPRLAETISPKTGPNKIRLANKAHEAAPQLLKDLAADGKPLPVTQGGLRELVRNNLAEAESALDDASNARVSTKTFSVKEIKQGLAEARANLTAKGVGRGKDVVPGPNAARVAIIDQFARELDQVRGPFVTYEAMRRFRQSYDQVAKAVYNPSVGGDLLKLKGEALGAADVTRVLRDNLAKWDPQTAAANGKYSLYRTLDDVMQAAEEAERARPKTGRALFARTLGAVVGGAKGDAWGAVVGAAVAPLFESVMSGVTSPYRAATVMQRLARAIRSGDTGRVQGIMHDLGTVARTTGAPAGRMPPSSPRPAYPRAAENDEDESPRDRVAMR